MSPEACSTLSDTISVRESRIAEPGDQPPAAPTLVIEPPRRWISLDLAELWRYRDLLSLLVWRDISANYRQSVIGFGWALIKPIVTTMIFTVIFGNFAEIPSDGIPYPVFSFAALLPWMYFARCLTDSTGSVTGGGALLTKIYFPRLILPLSSVVTGLLDFAVQFVVLVLLMLWFEIVPNRGILLVPVFLLLCATSALSVGLWLTALNVRYRDIGHAVPFAVQVWMWLCPVIYPISIIPEKWRLLYSLNPMVGVIEGFRWAMLGKAPPDWQMMAVSVAATLVLLLGGLYYFRKVETTFADVI